MTSLVTRCPACSTLFKVVPDQLRISEGWVRCGQCDEVFDAQAQMQPQIVVLPDSDPGQIQDQGAPAIHIEPEVEPQSVGEEKEVGASESSSVEEFGVEASAVLAPIADATAVQGDDRSSGSAPDAVAQTSMDAVPPEGAVEKTLDPVVDWMPLRESVAETSPRFEQSPPAAGIEKAQIVHPSFLTRASHATPGKWRWFYLLTLPLLALTLLLQVVVQQRDRIAATEPALATALHVLCQALGCQIQPLRQIESLVIESSSFIKIKADVYRLSFSLKNNALVPLALPSAELALTDLRDQSVVRRVLAPMEYGARAETLGPGDELAVVVPVAVKAVGGSGDKVTGYRLLVFYP